MKDSHIRDMASVYANLDDVSEITTSKTWDARYEWHYNAIKSGEFHPYDNLVDMGYERMALAFKLLHMSESILGVR